MAQAKCPEQCGCCQPPEPATPAPIDNRPALPQIAYRVGTFPSFRQAMLEAIAARPALGGLSTRRSDDSAVTFLELWAAVADVLTFYQERIANEAYLRTAVERDSVLRLARMLDYHLRPGLAATARLAFTADEGKSVRIPVGMRVMSQPEQDEVPQTFETIEEITADSRLNRLPVLPRPHFQNPLAQNRLAAFLTSDNAGWLAAQQLQPGEKVVLFGGEAEGGGSGGSLSQSSGWGVPSTISVPSTPFTPGVTIEQSFQYWEAQWGGLFTPPAVTDTPASAQGIDTSRAPEEKEIQEIQVSRDRFLLVWTSPIVKAHWSPASQARTFVRKMRLFGHNAPDQYLTVRPGSPASGPPVYEHHSNHPTPVQGSGLPLDALYPDLVAGGQLLIFDPWAAEADPSTQLVTITGISDTELVLDETSPFSDESLVDQRHRGTVTVVSVSPEVDLSDRRGVVVYQLKGQRIPFWTGDYDDILTLGSSTSLYLPAVRLDPGSASPEEGEDSIAVEIGRTILGRELQSGVAIRLDEINKGRPVLLQDDQQPPLLAEITGVRLEAIEAQDFLVVDVKAESTVHLLAGSAVLLGNVAQATHGEAVRNEILGNGNASLPFQSFVLQKAPLTYLSSAEKAGGQSSLELLVNFEKWEEVDTLFGQPETARVYTARQNDDGSTAIRFGDGKTGSRALTGQGNILANYRKGSGLAGRVKAGQLSIVLDAQVGLKSVTNPSDAEGGADPETLDTARQTAPTTVKTFERAVSLEDFETLITASGEVARAKASWVWRGLERAIHLTVAGQQGSLFSQTSLRSLHSGLTAQRDPNQTLLISNFCRTPIVVSANLQVGERFVRQKVADAARQALLSYLAFESVGFAQPIHLSDVYRVLQGVAGVLFVDIDTLHFKGHQDWSSANLAARDAGAEPAQAHLRLFEARLSASLSSMEDPLVERCFGSQPLPQVLPAEQAYLEVPQDDLVLNVTGGIE